jgi:uncharacterized tellurite resistance protein B-like protein
MEARTIFNLLEIAHKLHTKHKEHHQIDISISQRSDELGVGLQIAPAAILPDGVLALGRLAGFWLGNLTAVDNTLFRDESGNFATSGPVKGQCASLYIPFAAAQNRGPGLYTLSLTFHLVDARTSTSTEIAQSACKIALPNQPAWRRVEFFWPLIKLCMAVIRVDNEVVPAEIRGLREYLRTNLHFTAEDMPDLRTVMKDTHHGDLRQLLDSVALRLPLLSSEGLLELLCGCARLDGAINVHEHALLHRVADLLAITPARYAALAATAAPIAALPR